MRRRWWTTRWWWRKGRSFGFVLCKQCHHRWSRHFAEGFKINHPLDPTDWDVEYGCRSCNKTEHKWCEFGSLRDE